MKDTWLQIRQQVTTPFAGSLCPIVNFILLFCNTADYLYLCREQRKGGGA